MIWAGIVNQTIIGPYKVDEGIKLNSANYNNFIDETFQSCSFKVKCVFMHDNILPMYHEFFVHKRFTGKKIWNGHHQVLIWIQSKIYG